MLPYSVGNVTGHAKTAHFMMKRTVSSDYSTVASRYAQYQIILNVKHGLLFTSVNEIIKPK